MKNKTNFTKYISIAIVLAVLSPILLSYQNFQRYEAPLAIDKDDTTLNDALIAALKHSEEERRIKKVALNEDAEKKADALRKARKPTSIGERHELDTRGREEDARREESIFGDTAASPMENHE